MYPPWIVDCPLCRIHHRLAPFQLPGMPSIADMREWEVEFQPPNCNAPVPISGNPPMLRASLHRILLETGIAMSRATVSSDPQAWFALFRYGQMFCHKSVGLEFRSDFLDLDFHLRGLAADELSNGIAYFILREHYGLHHISDVAPLIAKTNLNPQLRYVPGSQSEIKPDLFCEDATGHTVIAEVKGTATPYGKLKIKKGLEQVQNIEPITKPLRGNCGRIVFGTHFKVDGEKKPGTTRTVIVDPPAEPGSPTDPASDEVIRHSYAKCFRFLGLNSLSDAILLKSIIHHVEIGGTVDSPAGRVYPLAPGGEGLLFGIAQPVFNAILRHNNENLFHAVSEAIRQLAEQSARVSDDGGYMLGNGIVVLPVGAI